MATVSLTAVHVSVGSLCVRDTKRNSETHLDSTMGWGPKQCGWHNDIMFMITCFGMPILLLQCLL